MQRCTWEGRCLFEELLSFPLDIHPEVGLLAGEVAPIFNFLVNLPTGLYNGCPCLLSYQSSGGASPKGPAGQCGRHGTRVPALGGEGPLEEGTAPRCSILFLKNNCLFIFGCVSSCRGAGFLWLRDRGLVCSCGLQASPVVEHRL